MDTFDRVMQALGQGGKRTGEVAAAVGVRHEVALNELVLLRGEGAVVKAGGVWFPAGRAGAFALPTQAVMQAA